MKIFISWSGDLSRDVGSAFNRWLPTVIQDIETFFSPDIDKGEQWNTVLRRELEASHIGLFCITRDNINRRWLNFEAGAMSIALKDAANKPRVLPFLLGMTSAELPLPLSQFQYTAYEKEDVRKLIHSINKAPVVPMV